MEIGYGTLEDVLMKMFGLRPAQRSALVGRLKYLARLGFPKAAKVGRGVRARYSVEDLIHVALALEITDLGVAPVPIVERITRDERLIRGAVARAWRTADLPGPERGRWSIDVAVLSGIGTGGGAERATPLIAELAAGDVVAEPTDRRDLPFDERRSAPGRRSRILMDAGKFLRDLQDAIGEDDPGRVPDFMEAMGAIVREERANAVIPGSAGRAGSE